MHLHFYLLNILNTLEPIVRKSSSERYRQLAEGLASGSFALAEFFDGENSVMVMSDNPEIRRNRLNLLGVLRNQARVLADFGKILG